MTSQLSVALRAAAAGVHPDEAAAGLIIGHAASLGFVREFWLRLFVSSDRTSRPGG